jgi:hypothetical protein
MTDAVSRPLATRFFEQIYASSNLESQLDDALLAAFGADPNVTETWPCGDLAYDPYDDSFELWGTKVGWEPTPEHVQAALALGFAQGWVCYTDGTERYYSAKHLVGELKPSHHGGEREGTRQERQHQKALKELERQRDTLRSELAMKGALFEANVELEQRVIALTQENEKLKLTVGEADC